MCSSALREIIKNMEKAVTAEKRKPIKCVKAAVWNLMLTDYIAWTIVIAIISFLGILSLSFVSLSLMDKVLLMLAVPLYFFGIYVAIIGRKV